MPTYTSNYNLAKPLVNSAVDQDLWGAEVNSDMDIIDSTMKTISDATAAAVILAIVYPIGSYYINETVSTNPATLFSFGTWTAVTDKFIVGHGSTYTSTGGAATVTIAQANLPTSITVAVTTSAPATNGTSGFASGDGTTPHTGITQTLGSFGSGTALSIIPPYQAAYIWKRTA